MDKPVSVSSLLVTLVSQEQLAEGLVRWNLTVAGEKVCTDLISLSTVVFISRCQV